MNKEMKYLLYLFIKIKEQGYIKNIKNSPNGAGITFESNLKKNLDNCPFPDFKGLEIKTKNIYSKQKVHLICIEPDMMFDTYKLTKEFGYLPKGKNKKFFYLEINALEKIRYIHNYFQLYVDDTNQRIVLLIFDAKRNLINNSVTWSYSEMRERLKVKLSTLAFITYFKSKKSTEEYYYYNRLTFYKNINFNKFLNAIKNGLITIKFTINVDINNDKIKNHGTEFSINKENLEYIFDIKC